MTPGRWTKALRYAVLVFAAVSSLPTLFSQTTGSINGLVTDPKGNALPKATISLIDGSRILGQATAGGDGRFQLPSVAPGRFEVKVEASGFRPVSRLVTVRPGVASEVRMGMELSLRNESLTVTADAFRVSF
jgi:hypothetical protein